MSLWPYKSYNVVVTPRQTEASNSALFRLFGFDNDELRSTRRGVCITQNWGLSRKKLSGSKERFLFIAFCRVALFFSTQLAGAFPNKWFLFVNKKYFWRRVWKGGSCFSALSCHPHKFHFCGCFLSFSKEFLGWIKNIFPMFLSGCIYTCPSFCQKTSSIFFYIPSLAWNHPCKKSLGAIRKITHTRKILKM